MNNYCTFIQITDVTNWRIQWNDAMVKLLLAEIKKHIPSFMSPINKQAWKNIAASINAHGYNLSADNCYVKWIGLKKKYKILKDANNKTGAAKQSWEYFDIINEMLMNKPEIAPLSIASSSRGFQLNQSDSNSNKEMGETSSSTNGEENENVEMHIESTTSAQNRTIRKRKSQTPTWVEDLIAQRQGHHERNYAQRERLLLLLEKYINK